MKTVEVPRRLKNRPRDQRGYIVPYFVTWVKDGKETIEGAPGAEPDFRHITSGKIARCYNHDLCWLCGLPLARLRAYAIGPMCAVNRTTSEPGSHLDCAEYAVRVCPFLSNPLARRPKTIEYAAGAPLARNPGVIALWVAPQASPFWVPAEVGNPGWLFQLPPPVNVSWWTKGHGATRTEVVASIASGLPALHAMARQEGDGAVLELAHMLATCARLLPPGTEQLAMPAN